MSAGVGTSRDLIDDLRGLNGFGSAALTSSGLSGIIAIAVLVFIESYFPAPILLAVCPGIVGWSLAGAHRYENPQRPRQVRQGWLWQLIIGGLTIIGVVATSIISSRYLDPQLLVGSMLLVLGLAVPWALQVAEYRQTAQAAPSPTPSPTPSPPSTSTSVSAPPLATVVEPELMPAAVEASPQVAVATPTPAPLPPADEVDPNIEAHAEAIRAATVVVPLMNSIRSKERLEKMLAEIKPQEEETVEQRPASQESVQEILAKASAADLYRQTLAIPLDRLADWSQVLGLSVPERLIEDGIPTTEARREIARQLVRRHHGRLVARRVEQEYLAATSGGNRASDLPPL